MRIEPSCIGPLQSPREAREFAEAKQRKREPIRLRGFGVARGHSKPKSRREFAQLRLLLRRSRDFGSAVELVDALERELPRYGGGRLPLPNEVIQNENATLSLFWEGLSAIFGDGRVLFLMGGASGLMQNGRGAGGSFNPDLCRALAAASKLQGIT